MAGITDGFHIVDIDEVPDMYIETPNYKSVTAHDMRDKVWQQIKFELDHGHYKVATERPRIISALGAIPKGPKGSGKIRLIHDCAKPVGRAVNDYAPVDSFKFQGLQDAVNMITPGCYLMKLDLSQAYRVVKLNPSNYSVTGLKYTLPGDNSETIMCDTRLPFGAARSVGIFHSLTQAVRVILATKYGLDNIVAYLDDFCIVSKTSEHCIYTLNVLLTLLRKLGFWINYNKIEGPTRRLTFLGIILDSVKMTIELPPERIQDLKDSLHAAQNKTKLTKRHVQRLAGKLNWACQCIYGGRFFMRRLLDCLVNLHKPWHRTRVTCDIRADISWWLNYLDTFNGKMDMVDPRPVTPVYIDACNVAAGAFYDGRCVYSPWLSTWPQVAGHHINYKEVLALEPAVTHWAPLWKNRRVFVHTDNQAAMAIINRGSCGDRLTMESLRRVFWLSAMFNFRLEAVYIPGHLNYVADAASRSHEPAKFSALSSFLQSYWYHSSHRFPSNAGGRTGQSSGDVQIAELCYEDPPVVQDPP